MNQSDDIFAPDDPWGRVRIGFFSLIGVLVAGTAAYRIVGLGWIDAVYQTILTVSTVGYTEVPPADGNIDGAYRIVSSVLILTGVGLVLYTAGLTFEALIEGKLTDHIGRSRMQREIDKMTGHVVVAGWGRVGHSIADALAEEGEGIVIVDRESLLAETQGYPFVEGEATEDKVLLRAGIQRAKALVVALDSDADNLFVTLSGRSLNPDLFIVTRASGESAIAKLELAGADRVVNPHQIGGQRMATFVIHPHVADFIGETVRDGGEAVRISETEVHEGGPLVGKTLEESGIAQECGVTILAVRHAAGGFENRPSATFTPKVGDVLISIGTPEQQQALRRWVP